MCKFQVNFPSRHRTPLAGVLPALAIESAMARCAVAVLAAAAAATAVQGQLFWGTAHHDIANTGRSPFESPGKAEFGAVPPPHWQAPHSPECTGDEKAPCWQEAVTSVGTDTYMNTGSVSLDNEFLVLGTYVGAVQQAL